VCTCVGPTLFIESISTGPHPELSLFNPHFQTYFLCNHILHLPFPKFYFRRSYSDEATDRVTEKMVFSSQKEQEIFFFNNTFIKTLGPTQSPIELARRFCAMWPYGWAALSKWTFIVWFVLFYCHHHGCNTIALQNFIPYPYRPTVRRQKPRKSLQLTVDFVGAEEAGIRWDRVSSL